LQRPFSESEAKCITLQIASALSFVHGRHLVHRDLKLSNLLYNNRGEIKLADFGMVRRLTPAPMTARVVTLWYRSPEILLGSQEYGAAVDMWSVSELTTLAWYLFDYT
jgi:serine/threonine protein kinase